MHSFCVQRFGEYCQLFHLVGEHSRDNEQNYILFRRSELRPTSTREARNDGHKNLVNPLAYNMTQFVAVLHTVFTSKMKNEFILIFMFYLPFYGFNCVTAVLMRR